MGLNINTKSNYTIDDIKQMYENDYLELTKSLTQNIGAKKEGTKEQVPSGQSQLSEIIGVPQQTIAGYMSFFKVG